MMDRLDWERQRRAAMGAQIAFYTKPVISFGITPPYYLASCDVCGWVGSSQECGTDEADDVYCPRCFASGADCGRVANLISEPVAEAARSIREVVEEADACAWLLAWRRRDEKPEAAKIMCGKMFMTKATADAAAERESNRWRIVKAIPAFAAGPITIPEEGKPNE